MPIFKKEVRDCKTCQHFTPCPCVFQRDVKGKCAADDGATVYIASNQNCSDWKRNSSTEEKWQT